MSIEVKDIKDKGTWYGLMLGEIVFFSNNKSLLRVPGGWILENWEDAQYPSVTTSVFIPFSN